MAVEQLAVRIPVLDMQLQGLAGQAKVEVEADIEIGEWRHVVMLGYPQAISCPLGLRLRRLPGQQEQLALAKGVADLGDRTQRRVLVVGAEIDRNRIEDIAKDSGERRQPGGGGGGEGGSGW